MSSRIKVLDSSTAMKIAAGEVIEKPASAVRELIDNALDAGATWISIEAEKGGKEFLAVYDNGHGMSDNDLRKCYLNHATSKITNFDDLVQLKTFGFRGEALASLAEISLLKIASYSQESDHGSEITLRFGKEEELLPKGMNQGTSIVIKDFFQNVPARLKFLSTDTSEYRAIIQEMLKKALAKPQITFELSHNKEKKYQLNASNELFDRIVDIFPELQLVLKPFIYEEEGIKVYGFLSHPSWYKASRSYQFLFVNGRAIEWLPFRQQITIAYNNLLPPSKFPAVFCYIEMDTEFIDFNVHPQKREIRFENEKKMANIVRRGIRLGVEHSGIVLDVEKNQEDKSETSFSSISKNTFKLPNSTFSQKPFGNRSFSYSTSSSSFSEKSYHKPSFSEKPIKNYPSSDQLQELFKQKEQILSPQDILPKAQYIDTIFNTYLIFEFEDSLFLVDFHAMHERIRYENILNQHTKNIPSQHILPTSFVLSKHEADIFEEIEESLSQLGFQIHRIGDSSFSIEAIPSVLDIGQVDNVLRELFVSDLGIQDSHVWDNICKMIACKGSSRSGDRLNEEEVFHLIKEWKSCTNPQSCPHGRPIVIPMTKGFFDKQFKRTGF